jgi:uncharacterized protein (TIGR02594 family)
VSEMAVPKWLDAMRRMTGIQEAAGAADNPKILAMRDIIAEKFPEQRSYCNLYKHDETPWCGLAAAAAMAEADISGPFGPTDTDKWMWALAWSTSPLYQKLSEPKQGCVVVMKRSGGGHVTLFEEKSGSNKIKCRGGNQSNAVNVQTYDTSGVIGYYWPKAAGEVPVARRELDQGDTGEDVKQVQRILAIPIDGQFGPTTEGAVKGYQAAMGLAADGVVGDMTWAALDELDAKMKKGSSGLSPEEGAAINDVVARHEQLLNYSWKDRGKAPTGHLYGMAKVYGLAVHLFGISDSAIAVMSKADAHNDKDAFTVMKDAFDKAMLDNDIPGLACVRHTFVLLIGLGMRESSGNHWEGRDTSASNTSPDTAEAGLFQTSWDIRSASPEFQKLFDSYWIDPQGFVETFNVGVTPSASKLANYGSGAPGTRYQWLAKYSPAFAALMTGIGVRVRCNHWGPINRKEVEILTEVDQMLQEVERVISTEPAPPVPEARPVVTVQVDPPGSARVVVEGDE